MIGRSLLGLVALATGLVGVVGASAPASAAVNFTTVYPTTNLTDPDTIGVFFTLDPSSTYFAVAQCRAAAGADLGRDCNGDTDMLLPTSGFPVVGGYRLVYVELDVDKSFTDVSFVPGMSPLHTSTTCLSGTGNAQCGVTVSEYTGTFPALNFIDGSLTNITFS